MSDEEPVAATRRLNETIWPHGRPAGFAMTDEEVKAERERLQALFEADKKAAEAKLKWLLHQLNVDEDLSPHALEGFWRVLKVHALDGTYCACTYEYADWPTEWPCDTVDAIASMYKGRADYQEVWGDE